MEQQPQPEQEPVHRIAVWVGALGAYHAGHLHGEWSDADVEPSQLWDSIFAVLESSPIPDEGGYCIFDHQGFEGIRLGEYENVERITTIAKLLREHGTAFAAFFSYDEYIELETAEEAFQDAYIGTFDHEADIEAHFYEERGLEQIEEEAHKHVPEGLRAYLTFDTAQYLYDLVANGDLRVQQRGGKFYVFLSP